MHIFSSIEFYYQIRKIQKIRDVKSNKRKTTLFTTHFINFFPLETKIKRKKRVVHINR